MKIIKKIAIIIGVILFANYAVRLPMYNQEDYLSRDFGIYSIEHVCKCSILKQNTKEIFKTNDIVEIREIPVKLNLIFAKVKVIFEIANIPVYYWQLARGNLDASRFIGLAG